MGIEGSGDRERRCGHGLPSVVLCGWNRFTIVCRNTVLATLPPDSLAAARVFPRIWGVHRNWARWTSDPTWPLEALKGRSRSHDANKWVQTVQRQKREGMLSARLAGEPAKAGWDAFTTDSQARDSLKVNAAGLVCCYVMLCAVAVWKLDACVEVEWWMYILVCFCHEGTSTAERLLSAYWTGAL